MNLLKRNIRPPTIILVTGKQDTDPSELRFGDRVMAQFPKLMTGCISRLYMDNVSTDALHMLITKMKFGDR